MNITLKDMFSSLGRVLIALLFLISGFGKLSAPAGTIAYITASGMPFPVLGYAAALFVEIVLASLLVVGLKTRAVALLMALFTLAAGAIFHTPLSDPNQFIHFFKNISIAGGMLQIFAFGAGSLSIDAWLASGKNLFSPTVKG